MKLSDEEIKGVLIQEIQDARGHEDELSSNREKALDYYFGKPRGDEIEGGSTLQSLDMSNAVNATMAQLSDMLKTTLLEFVPTSEEDEQQAQLESDFVMDIAQRSGGETIWKAGAFDALTQSNGWIKVFVEETVEEWEEDYTDISELTILEAQAPTCPSDQVEAVSQQEKEDGLYDLTVSHTVTKKKLRIEAIAPEFMLHAPSHDGLDMQDCRFVAERKLVRKSDLIEMGYDKAQVMELPKLDSETWGAAYARDYGYDAQVGGKEPSTEVVEVFECYQLLDIEGNGKARRYRVMLAGDGGAELLGYEPARFVPYCTGTALPVPHRTKGQSFYDLLRHVQDGKTSVLRQWLDNHKGANHASLLCIEGQANMNDVLAARPVRAIRTRSPDAVTPLPFTDIGPSAMNALGYLDDMRSERAGAALDMTTAEMQVSHTSATAAANEYANKEMMSAMYCRNLVETLVKSTYRLIHKALRVYFDDTMKAKLRGKWAQTNPKHWPERENLRVMAGLSSSERTQRINSLNALIAYQAQAMQAGLQGELVNGDGMYAALADWQRATGLGEVEEYWIDPASPEAQQAAQAKQQQAQEQAKQAEQLQQRMFDAEQANKRYMHDTELRYKYWSDQLDAEVKEAEIVADNVGKMELEAVKQAGGADNATQDN